MFKESSETILVTWPMSPLSKGIFANVHQSAESGRSEPKFNSQFYRKSAPSSSEREIKSEFISYAPNLVILYG